MSDLSAVNPSWADWIPGYFLFKKAPTARQIAEHRLRVAERDLDDAALARAEAEGEIKKQQHILAHLGA